MEIPAESSRWMDWLEEQPDGEPTWEQAKSRWDKPSSGRLSVEIPDDPKPAGKVPRMAFTKEQKIWDEALRRSERMRNRQGMSIQKWLTILMVLATGYLVYLVWPLIKGWTGTLRRSSPDMAMEAETFWGNYQPRLQDVPEKDLLVHLTTLPDIALPSPIQRQDLLEPSAGLLAWARLSLQEMTFSEGGQPSSTQLVDPRVLPSGPRSWAITREAQGGMTSQLGFREEIEVKGGRALLTVQRSRGEEGAVHKIMLNKNGIMAWTWKMVIDGQSLEGRLLRDQRPDMIEWSGKILGGKQWSGSRNFPSDGVLLPALWAPSLWPLRHHTVVHPIGGRISSGDIFWEDTALLKSGGEVLELISSLEEWKEVWRPVGIKEDGS